MKIQKGRLRYWEGLARDRSRGLILVNLWKSKGIQIERAESDSQEWVLNKIFVSDTSTYNLYLRCCQ